MSVGMARTHSTYAIYPSLTALDSGADALTAAGFRYTDISVLYSDEAVAGAATGVTVAVVLGYLAGIGALTIPGVGPLLAAGPILATLAGIGAAGASGLVRAMSGLGIPEEDAERYLGRLRQGGILVSANCDDLEWVSRAKQVLSATGAEDVAEYQP